MHVEPHNYLFQSLFKAEFMNLFWIFFFSTKFLGYNQHFINFNYHFGRFYFLFEFVTINPTENAKNVAISQLANLRTLRLCSKCDEFKTTPASEKPLKNFKFYFFLASICLDF